MFGRYEDDVSSVSLIEENNVTISDSTPFSASHNFLHVFKRPSSHIARDLSQVGVQLWTEFG